MTTIVEPPVFRGYEPRPATALRLGTVILHEPHTGVPVRWTLASDPTSCCHGHLSMSYSTGGAVQQLLLHRGDVVVVETAVQA